MLNVVTHCVTIEENMEDTHDEFLVERDIDENVVDNVTSVEEQMLREDSPMVLDVGMMFKDEKELRDFYKGYAYYI